MPVLEHSSDVLRQFRDGDLDAFETLFREHQAEVYRWIIRVVRNGATAEDLTIETFWRIYQARARFDPERRFGAWARRIATNVAIDHLRKADPEVELISACSNTGPEPVIASEIRAKTVDAFRRLPPRLQVAAMLALIEEQSYKQISEALGISAGAVKVRVFRALRLLRKELKRQGIEP